MILTIAKQEFRGLCRDGRYRLTVGILLVLILASTAIGWANYYDLIEQAEHAAEHDYQRWRSQDPTHPHNAAHYGNYAFKTPRPLAIIDGGIEPYIGASLYYGAHQPSEVAFPPAQDATALQRFGDIGVGEVARALLPLLAILLSFGAFASEREQGTLRQLLSLGVKPSALLWGKALGIASALAVVLIPAALFGLAVAFALSPAEYRLDEIERAGLLGLTYTLYLGIFLFLSLAISARCQTARSALTILLVFWVVTVFALPRGLLDLGARFHPSPSSDFEKAYAADMAKETEAHVDKVFKKVFAQYKVSKQEELPFDITALYMKASDEGSLPTIDRYFNKRFDIYQSQNCFLEWGALLSPAAGLTLVSMALTGNDLEQHRDFVRQVETQRRTMNNLMTDYMLLHQEKRKEGDELKGDPTLWGKLPPFVYHQPSWELALKPYYIALCILGLWFLMTLLYARRSVTQASILF